MRRLWSFLGHSLIFNTLLLLLLLLSLRLILNCRLNSIIDLERRIVPLQCLLLRVIYGLGSHFGEKLNVLGLH